MTYDVRGTGAIVRVATADDLPDAFALRLRVFCEEQGVPVELERDGRDDDALHLVAVAHGRVVGTCRLLVEGGTAVLQRMAVEGAVRGRGVGADLLALAHREAADAGAREMTLHAQLPALAFYARAGYVAVGPEFEDARLAHRLMRRPLPAPGP